jgi:hypothetical protein
LDAIRALTVVRLSCRGKEADIAIGHARTFVLGRTRDTVVWEDMFTQVLPQLSTELQGIR